MLVSTTIAVFDREFLIAMDLERILSDGSRNRVVIEDSRQPSPAYFSGYYEAVVIDGDLDNETIETLLLPYRAGFGAVFFTSTGCTKRYTFNGSDYVCFTKPFDEVAMVRKIRCVNRRLLRNQEAKDFWTTEAEGPSGP